MSCSVPRCPWLRPARTRKATAIGITSQRVASRARMPKALAAPTATTASPRARGWS
jgi:hypothetical protein